MKQRSIPFGYQILNGEFALQTPEAETVRQIFKLYINGLGYKSIAGHLNAGPVLYRPDAAWDQNMVKRILENRRYLGEKDFPEIISAADFDAVAAKRKSNPRCKQQRRKLAEPSREYRLLPYEPPAKVRRMTNEINRTLEKSPDPDQIRPMIFACAAEKYKAIGVIYDG